MMLLFHQRSIRITLFALVSLLVVVFNQHQVFVSAKEDKDAPSEESASEDMGMMMMSSDDMSNNTSSDMASMTSPDDLLGNTGPAFPDEMEEVDATGNSTGPENTIQDTFDILDSCRCDADNMISCDLDPALEGACMCDAEGTIQCDGDEDPAAEPDAASTTTSSSTPDNKEPMFNPDRGDREPVGVPTGGADEAPEAGDGGDTGGEEESVTVTATSEAPQTTPPMDENMATPADSMDDEMSASASADEGNTTVTDEEGTAPTPTMTDLPPVATPVVTSETTTSTTTTEMNTAETAASEASSMTHTKMTVPRVVVAMIMTAMAGFVVVWQ
mmetsp:Transcript_48327/g.54788  ORF Transcript_48327/g.54788 Transcript_48327/m.54788 type:complete len:330 (+) Transcript_48327:56-1045(+)